MILWFLPILYWFVTLTSFKCTWWLSLEIRFGEKLRFDSRSQIKFDSDLQKFSCVFGHVRRRIKFWSVRDVSEMWLWASLSERERAFDFAFEKSGALESVLPACQIESVPEVCGRLGYQRDLQREPPMMPDKGWRGATGPENMSLKGLMCVVL